MGEIRFVGTGETRGYPYPVCKKIRGHTICCFFLRNKKNLFLNYPQYPLWSSGSLQEFQHCFKFYTKCLLSCCRPFNNDDC